VSMSDSRQWSCSFLPSSLADQGRWPAGLAYPSVHTDSVPSLPACGVAVRAADRAADGARDKRRKEVLHGLAEFFAHGANGDGIARARLHILVHRRAGFATGLLLKPPQDVVHFLRHGVPLDRLKGG